MFSDSSNSVRGSMIPRAANSLISCKSAGISVILALRAVGPGAITGSGNTGADLTMSGTSYRGAYSGADIFSGDQFRDDSRSGAGRNHGVGKTGADRVHGGFEFGAHATGCDFAID